MDSLILVLLVSTLAVLWATIYHYERLVERLRDDCDDLSAINAAIMFGDDSGSRQRHPANGRALRVVK